MTLDGRVRAVIDAVRPAIDCGRFADKRVVGDDMVVEADCFTDGHDVVRVMLRWRAEGDDRFSETEMAPLGNDLWRGAFTLRTLGRYVYTVAAWLDHFESWRHELERRVDADDIRIAARVGATLIAAGPGARAAATARPSRPGLRALLAEAADESATSRN
jgi:starch synthase (maltosyl-transferring)